MANVYRRWIHGNRKQPSGLRREKGRHLEVAGKSGGAVSWTSLWCLVFCVLLHSGQLRRGTSLVFIERETDKGSVAYGQCSATKRDKKIFELQPFGKCISNDQMDLVGIS